MNTVDIIVGAMGIVLANSMMGELTPRMAEAIASSPALKYLLPLRTPDVEIIGAPKEPLPHLVDQLIKRIQEIISQSAVLFNLCCAPCSLRFAILAKFS